MRIKADTLAVVTNDLASAFRRSARPKRPWWPSAACALTLAVGACSAVTPAGGSPSSTATTATRSALSPTLDAAAVEACRKALAHNTVEPGELLAIANVAVLSGDPKIWADGLALKGAAQAIIDAGPDNYVAQVASIPVDFKLQGDCINGHDGG